MRKRSSLYGLATRQRSVPRATKAPNVSLKPIANRATKRLIAIDSKKDRARVAMASAAVRQSGSNMGVRPGSSSRVHTNALAVALAIVVRGHLSLKN